MKIRQIITSIEDESAGPSYSVVRLAEALGAAGIQSGLMSISNMREQRSTRYVDYDHFPPTSSLLPFVHKFGHSQALKAAIQLEASSGALLHVHGLWRFPNVYPGLIAKETGAPLILSPRGMLGPAALEFSKRRKMVFWWMYQRRAIEQVRCFHATAKSEVDDIRSFGLEQPVAVIPNGIDTSDDALDRKCRPKGLRQVLHLGRIHPKKAIDQLLLAWSYLGNKTEGWLLRIVGPSELGYKEKLQRMTRDLSLLNVSFEAPLFGASKRQAYSEAEVFVLPTLHENFGMVVAEALAEGTPVISTIGAPWEGLVRERCGWWVKHGADPLAEALKLCMTLTDQDRQKMGERGHAWMRREYSWEAVAEKMISLYLWCSGSGDRPVFVQI